MKEQSQLDDMRAAIRGDLERAKARREPPVLAAVPEPEPEVAPEPESLRPQVSETAPPDQVAEASEPQAPEPAPEPDLPFAPEPEPRPSFLSKLLRRD